MIDTELAYHPINTLCLWGVNSTCPYLINQLINLPYQSQKLVKPSVIFTYNMYCLTSIYWLTLLYVLVAKNGVVIAVEKKHKSPLYDESTINKVRERERERDLIRVSKEVFNGVSIDWINQR